MIIGKLIEVDIRDLWEHEQYNFSNWLAKPENTEELNDIIGMMYQLVPVRYTLVFH